MNAGDDCAVPHDIVDPTTEQDAGVAADDLVDEAIALVATWLVRATELETRNDRNTMKQLGDLVADEAGVAFVMQFVDRVARPDDAKVAALQLSSLVDESPLPGFLSMVDRVLLQAGARLAPLLPRIVIPLAKRRMRSIVGHLVAPAEPEALAEHLGSQRQDGYVVNVNLLGEAVLGEREADARLARLKAMIAVPDIDYVSVKITAVASQINHWDHDQSLARISARLAELVDCAVAASPVTFINFDMEEYHDLHLTVGAFKVVLDDPKRTHVDAGIVLQAYLPDAFAILQELSAWAGERHVKGGGTIKIRLVKGANLAMEQVEAAMHGWPQAPFGSKIETDANYRRCMDWVLRPERLTGTRIGVASHNLFDVAWVKLLAERRGVASRVQFEMLQGMASGQAKAVNEATEDTAGAPMLLYTPAVGADDFDVAIGYLFRRLEENAAPDNFMRKLFDLEPGSAAFDAEANFFRRGTTMRHEVADLPYRTQNRLLPAEPRPLGSPFTNEPDTDPSLPANQPWIHAVATSPPSPCVTSITTSSADVRAFVAVARQAQLQWRQTPATERRAILHRVADGLVEQRGQLISTMMHEASKAFAEADVEVSEAIDFAWWYGDRCVDLDDVDGADFTPFGLVVVVPPWNFPTAIPAGGVLAALAAGNAAILKPAPETPRCSEIIVEACWHAGVPKDVVQLVRTPDNEVGQLLVESADAVILTGSNETADLFRSWNPQLRLFAETSGKNALIITASADLDLAAQDLVRSAFGHAGQKCSAASLAILVGDVASSERFRRQIVDAVESLTLGASTNLGTDIAPLVGGGNERLLRAVQTLDAGESWLVRPVLRPDGILSPGVREGVTVDSWFHRTECFGPILGLMAAADLDEAIEIANSSDFGLTGGIHTLDPHEVEIWSERIQVGNGYVNRPITGAVVQRQPFGGWKRSSVGPGAKAGGVNYAAQLGTWRQAESDDGAGAGGGAGGGGGGGGDNLVSSNDFAAVWAEHFAVSHDDTHLFCEANIFRYRPLHKIGLYIGGDAPSQQVELVKRAAAVCGVEVVSVPEGDHDHGAWLEQLKRVGIDRVRVVGAEISDELAAAANRLHIRLANEPVTAAGRIELQHDVREQSMSVTLHRFGNLVAAPSPT